MGKLHRYTEEQNKFLAENVEGRSHKELTEMFNELFGTELNINQISHVLFRRGLKNKRDTRFENGHAKGNTTRFKPGNVPHNKGVRGVYKGGEATHFKKGHTPYNIKPVGSERINVDGYVEIKVSQPGNERASMLLFGKRQTAQFRKVTPLYLRTRTEEILTLIIYFLSPERSLEL